MEWLWSSWSVVSLVLLPIFTYAGFYLGRGRPRQWRRLEPEKKYFVCGVAIDHLSHGYALVENLDSSQILFIDLPHPMPVQLGLEDMVAVQEEMDIDSSGRKNFSFYVYTPKTGGGPIFCGNTG